MASVLIIDDEPNIRRMLASLLRAEGYTVHDAATGAAGVEVAEELEPDVVLLDLVMPGATGLETLPRLRESLPEVPVVMMSGQASLSDAVKATKLGAFHFLEKPLSPEAVLVTLSSAIELARTRRMNRRLREELGESGDLIGGSEPMRRVRELVARVAPTDSRVLITGESGTGKELVAAALHHGSRRAQRALIRVNCAAIPRDLVESELFGHEKGAFTGATERRRGRFELADGGTLFLDEIGDLDPAAQAKLLRALEAGEIERVGGDHPIPVDVRVIAATNRDLEADVAAGRFREDLYFRILVIPIEMPPLRDRLEDVPALVQHFIEQRCTRDAIRPPRFTSDAIRDLQSRRWPGNVRELANIVERLMILHPGEAVDAARVEAVLPRGESFGSTASTDATRAAMNGALSELLDSYERALITSALDETDGNIADAARRLSTDRANLYRRIRRLGINR